MFVLRCFCWIAACPPVCLPACLPARHATRSATRSSDGVPQVLPVAVDGRSGRSASIQSRPAAAGRGWWWWRLSASGTASFATDTRSPARHRRSSRACVANAAARQHQWQRWRGPVHAQRGLTLRAFLRVCNVRSVPVSCFVHLLVGELIRRLLDALLHELFVSPSHMTDTAPPSISRQAEHRRRWWWRRTTSGRRVPVSEGIVAVANAKN